MDEQKQKDTRSANRGMLAAVIGLVVVVLIVRTVLNQKNPAPDGGGRGGGQSERLRPLYSHSRR